MSHASHMPMSIRTICRPKDDLPNNAIEVVTERQLVSTELTVKVLHIKSTGHHVLSPRDVKYELGRRSPGVRRVRKPAG